MKLTRTFYLKIDLWKNYPSLKGRKYLSPTDLTPDEMKSLLYSAMTIKGMKENLKYLDFHNKKITYLSHTPCSRLQTCIHNASVMLKMPMNILIDPYWELMPYPQDVGKLIASTSDIIFCQPHRHSKAQVFAKYITIPFVNISSCRFTTLQILSDLLTLHEHFHYLKGLKIAWIGTACPLLNTYLTVAPQFGIDTNFMSITQHGKPVSPSCLNQLQPSDRLRVKECDKISEVVRDANVIVVTNHKEKSLLLKLSDVKKYANKQWVLLHTLPRSSYEIEDQLFNSDRNLLWNSFVNSQFVCAAIISRFLYDHLDIREKN